MNIGCIKLNNPSNVLSYLYPNEFEFENVKCASFISFLHSLKLQNVNEQRKICSMTGVEVEKNLSRSSKYHIFYWNGKDITRESKDFYYLVWRALFAMYQQCPEFCSALENNINRVKNKNFFQLIYEAFTTCINSITRKKHSIHEKKGFPSNESILSEKEYTDLLISVYNTNNYVSSLNLYPNSMRYRDAEIVMFSYGEIGAQGSPGSCRLLTSNGMFEFEYGDPYYYSETSQKRLYHLTSSSCHPKLIGE